MRSLLVTGASGFLGWHICHLLSKDWHIIGTYCHHPITFKTGATIPLDVTDTAAVQAYWEQFQPDAVLHTAAISKVNQCEQQPDRSYRVNVSGALDLAQRCAAADIPFVFTSTDLVFDGDRAPYSETDQPQPLNVYGRQKATAEAQILAVYPNATICRLPLLYGAATPIATSFLQNFMGAIATGKPLTLFTDEVRTPAEVTDVVHGLGLVLTQGVTGILHLGGPQRINRYEFGLKMADAFHFSADLLTPCTQASVNLPAPRPKDVSLDSRKAFALGYSPRKVEDGLRAIAAQRSDAIKQPWHLSKDN